MLDYFQVRCPILLKYFHCSDVKYFQGGVASHDQTEVVRTGQPGGVCGVRVRQAVGPQSSGESGGADPGQPAQAQVTLGAGQGPGECHHLAPGQGQQ